MATGKDAIDFAKKLVGRPYVLGAKVVKDNPDYAGAFDCAEFIAFTIFQVFGKIYGCDSNAPGHIHTADAYTGYFQRDAESLGEKITVEEAANIPGAILLRYPLPGANGHIAFSEGTGNKTVEANCTKYGCIESVINGRRWDCGILIPGIDYDRSKGVVAVKPPVVVYKLETPNMKADFIAKIQAALGINVDGFFGTVTHSAIVEFQKKNGLVVDGEIMQGGVTARSLGVI